MDLNTASLPPDVLSKIPKQMLQRMARYQRRGRVETFTRYLPDGTPSPIQPNRIDPLNDVSREILETLPKEDRQLRFQQWCYYYAYHLGMMTRDAIDDALENQEMQWLYDNLKIAPRTKMVDYLRPRRVDGMYMYHIGRARFMKFARAYHKWLSDHSESTPEDVRREQSLMLERTLQLLQAKMEDEGLESISVSDMIALMKRQSSLLGLDSPKRVETSSVKVTFTGEDMSAALQEVQEFEAILGAGTMIDAEPAFLEEGGDDGTDAD